MNVIIIIWEESDCEGGWRDLAALASHIEENERDWLICVVGVVGVDGVLRGEDRSEDLRAAIDEHRDEIRRQREMEPGPFDDPAHISGVNAFTSHAA